MKMTVSWVILVICVIIIGLVTYYLGVVKKMLIDNLLARVEGDTTMIGAVKYATSFVVGFALGTIIKLGNIT